MSVKHTAILLLAGIYFLPAQSQTDGCNNNNTLQGTYKVEHIGNKPTVNYAHIREADIMWLKRVWRRVDLRQKINHPLYFPEAPLNDRMSLFDVIKCGLLYEGILTAYDPGPLGDNDQFTVPMTKVQVLDKLVSIDTVYTTDIETDEEVPEIIREEVTSRDIKMYEIKEEWFFDNQRSVMDVRIIGICPMVEKRDETTGEFRGYSPLFWIYFPAAREVFVKHKVFTPRNDISLLSYDDLFMKRKFGSYIVKESNVYDRYIQEYKGGMDALLESERIKEDIFIMEHDLWTY